MSYEGLPRINESSATEVSVLILVSVDVQLKWSKLEAWWSDGKHGNERVFETYELASESFRAGWVN